MSAAVKERSEEGKRAKAANRIREVEEEREAKKRNLRKEDADADDDEEEREGKMRNLRKEDADADDEEEVSSGDSSLRRELYLLQRRRPDFFADPDLFDAFESEIAKVQAKLDCQMEMPTLQYFTPSPMLHDPKLLPVRESGTKAVLSAAKFVLGLSSSLDGKPLTRCSGFWVDWDRDNKIGTILTTAHLIRSKGPPMNLVLGGEEYAPDANIIVHLLDNTSVEGRLLYYQAHYDLALFRVRVEQPVQLPSFNDGVKCAQEIFPLGRDKVLNLTITYGRAEYLNPTEYERYHYMYCHCEDDHKKNEYDNGGPVIDLDGKVVGMISKSPKGSFIPSSILLKCLDSWKKYGYIPRPHLGLTFLAIKLLGPAHVEMIWRMYNIDDGLVVQEVSKGSHAEKLGIRRGDIIERFNGQCISTTVELENMLLSICKGPLDSQKVHVSVEVFHTRKTCRRTRELTVNVSDCGEVIVRDPLAS